MSNPALRPYFPVLNSLAEMQESKIYAVRAQDLARAEATIVYLATELASVKDKMSQMNDQLRSINFIAEAI